MFGGMTDIRIMHEILFGIKGKIWIINLWYWCCCAPDAVFQDIPSRSLESNDALDGMSSTLISTPVPTDWW